MHTYVYSRFKQNSKITPINLEADSKVANKRERSLKFSNSMQKNGQSRFDGLRRWRDSNRPEARY